MNHKASCAAQTPAHTSAQIIGQIDGRQVVGLDIAKRVFQLYTVDIHTGEISNIQLKRAKVLEYFANRSSCVVGIEACGGAHHWARELSKLGHHVRLIHAKAVRPFVDGNKTDAADARGIWLAIAQPGARFVAIKSLQQQQTLTLHRQRQLLISTKVAHTNSLRGLLYEFGVTLGQGPTALRKAQAALDQLSDELDKLVIDSLREQLEFIGDLQRRIKAMDTKIEQVLRTDEDMKRVLSIPGVGPLTATAVIATMGSAHAFKNAREFCAWLGLVPKQRGSGGKVRLLGISKRGDSYVRTLLIHGARSVVHQGNQPSAWLQSLKERRPGNVAVVAQAAKMARTIWAVTASQRAYQPHYQSAAVHKG